MAYFSLTTTAKALGVEHLGAIEAQRQLIGRAITLNLGCTDGPCPVRIIRAEPTLGGNWKIRATVEDPQAYAWQESAPWPA